MVLSEQAFKNGQKDGINGVIAVMTNVIDGTDKGPVNQRLTDKNLEKLRRVFLMWRNHIIESSRKDKTAMSILVETKKIMDLPSNG